MSEKPDFEEMAQKIAPLSLMSAGTAKECLEAIYRQGFTAGEASGREKEPNKFALQSASGVHIGMWDDLDALVHNIQPQYPNSKIIHLIDVTPPETTCETCKGDPQVCAEVPSLRHCEKANRNLPKDES